MYQPRNTFDAGQSSSLPLNTAVLTFERTLDIVRRQWPLIASVVGVCLAVVVAYALTATPYYTSSVSILVDTRQAVLNKSTDAANSTLIDPGFVESQVEILTSDDLVRSVVDSLNLTSDPEYTQPDMISSVVGTIVNLLGLGEPESKDFVKRMVVASLKKNLKVERVGVTYVLTMSFRSTVPEKAAKIANALADAYMTSVLEAKYQSTKRASEWLQRRSAELQQQAMEADRAVQTFKAENNIVGTSKGLMNEQQLSDVNTQLIQARAGTAEAKARLDRINAITDQDLAQPTVTDALSNTVITRLRAQYLDLAAQYADWSNKYGKDHQASVNLASRMQELRRAIKDEVKRIADAYKSDYEIARSRESSLEADLNKLVSQSGSASQAQVKLRNLESAADTYRTLYNNFLQQLQEATQNQSFPISEARIISTAQKADKKSWPKTGLLLLGGLIGGLCFGLGGAVGKEMLTEVLRTPSEVEAETALQCLGTLPELRPDAADGSSSDVRGAALTRYALEHPFSRFAETLRNIKTAVDLSRLTRETNVIAVVSSLPKEGKTTVAANLAHLAALAGHRTLLIDGDLHTQSLTRKLAPGAKSGLVEALADPAQFEHHIQVDRQSNLNFLPSVVRARLVNSADVLSSQSMSDFLKVAKKKYDYIFVDLAPVLPVTDAKAAGHLVDAIVYVVEWGKTRRAAVNEAILDLEVFRSKVVGIVLNRANPKTLKRIESYKGRHYSDYYVEQA
ncbi:polysaccharide biosynthesis tyrosine autokinase [Bradyrhizobium sp. KB893862 SZCCT0404]|uniref:polysaccharide biosynthesis tyrosine autokinase n=1 Tax=Bradyrhizobium sp. KB893862 SZCCT0404 TaxID=2807672 RepID=UPI001BAA75C4|nr:polysaccharide biosynthesis tyrosine autokinase [Bradyrhizobium sp. KB893862 SZCCT0404]MBR1177895.1 polysaccharide biosynthesis tyrosine autokinase [Bradyrhizobium sp. KB893862 SZCCT0404]